MIIHDVVQRSVEWYELRMGIPTASSFSKILTPTGNLSDSADEYLNKILCEYFMRESKDEIPVKTFYMERGSEMEVEARQYYEFKYDVKTVSVGFITDDKRTMGASPDCFVGDDGQLEIKCPMDYTHLKTYFSGEIDGKYWPQIQGQLLISEREWSDYLSYHPNFPPITIRTMRDDVYLTKMRRALTQFTELFHERKELLLQAGMIPATAKPKKEKKPETQSLNQDYFMAG